jgi:C-8 sterol isomerase
MGYIFEPEALHALAKKRIGLPHEEMVQAIRVDLAKSHPGHIEMREKWILSICGGVMGIMTIMHGSLSEYVLVYGTPIGTEGYSGRYRVDIYDVLLAGEMWTYTEEAFRKPIITMPGEMAHLSRRQAKGVKIFEGSWMLEYGRGPIPTTLPFALTGAVTSLDLKPIAQTLGQYGWLAIKELCRGKI